jgi:hypothetical protein
MKAAPIFKPDTKTYQPRTYSDSMSLAEWGKLPLSNIEEILTDFRKDSELLTGIEAHVVRGLRARFPLIVENFGVLADQVFLNAAAPMIKRFQEMRGDGPALPGFTIVIDGDDWSVDFLPK